MIINMNDPLDDSIVYSTHNTIFVAVHDDVMRNDFLNILKPYRLKVYDANRRPDSIIKDFDIPCLARFFDSDYLSEIGEWLIDYLNSKGDNIPHLILGYCHDERLRHPDLHYLSDFSGSDFRSLMNNMVRRADKLFNDENPTPQTKEYVVSSIHDESVMARIRSMIEAMGASILETNIDDEFFDVALFNGSFIRIIDTRTLERFEAEIRALLERVTDTATFLVIGADKPLPFSHPRLRRYQDVTSEWIATEIAKGKEWDEQECERYHRAMMKAR
jgi:hypothetical protein